MVSSSDVQQITQWLASIEPSTPTTRASFERAAHELVEVQGQLDALYAALGRRPELWGEAKPLVEQVTSRRRVLLTRVGEQLLDWVQRGGRVELLTPLERAGEAVVRGTSDSTRPQGEPMGEGERGMVKTFLDLAGAPREVATPAAIDDELDGLEALADTMPRWPSLPRHVQRGLLGMLVARLRGLKELSGLSVGARSRVKALLAQCPVYAKSHPLGAHVNGLQVTHEPLRGAWRDDAQAQWELMLVEVDTLAR